MVFLFYTNVKRIGVGAFYSENKGNLPEHLFLNMKLDYK